MARVRPTQTQRDRLLWRNAHRCCVCKRLGIGVELHHIDGNPRRSTDENLAVLCVEEHDQHHRPHAYTVALSHQELSADAIANYKARWERFVMEARKPNPIVFGTVTAYGTVDCIHSAQIVMQWPDGDIEYSKSWHLLDGNVQWLGEQPVIEVESFGGQGFKLNLIDEPMPVSHCPCCGKGLLRAMESGFATRLADPAWPTDSACAIYFEPAASGLALVFRLGDREIAAIELHVCTGQAFHYSYNDHYEQRIDMTDEPIRKQANRIVCGILREWAPARVWLGTGDGDAPTVVEWSGLNEDLLLLLPACWEAG